MKRNNEILNELREISPLLAGIPKGNIQTVPIGYFDNLEMRICIHSLLHQYDTKEYFIREKPGVPTGYFEQLSDSVLSKIKEEGQAEREESFPVLNTLKNKNVFKVPTGYFDDLSKQIIGKTVVKENAKVVSIGATRWWKYAAVAMIAGLMLISVFYIFNSGGNQISQYLAASQQYQTTSQIEDGIAALKDDDIIKYLETHGNITDNEMLSDQIDTNTLPSELDYLKDDNTLNDYLEKINMDQK